APDEHVGLGVGTQLGLAVGKALALAQSMGSLSIFEIARRVGRGARSALGIHGFVHGGFLVEGGQQGPDEIGPLLAHLSFPAAWPILRVSGAGAPGLHGAPEREAFGRLPAMPDALTDALCRLVLLGMLPALQARDLQAFGEALHDFNARVGEAFASVQGG